MAIVPSFSAGPKLKVVLGLLACYGIAALYVTAVGGSITPRDFAAWIVDAAQAVIRWVHDLLASRGSA